MEDSLSPDRGWRQACQWRGGRRAFLQCSAAALAGLALPGLARPWPAQAQPPGLAKGFIRPHPAAYVHDLGKGMLECRLCPRQCQVLPGERGDCGVRENRGGQYVTLAYGNPCAVHIDPIEKKPFFHVLPGTPSFSIATAGCNLHCQFCQNWEISQAKPEKTYNFDLPPAKVVAEARARGCPSIAYTYVEPIIFYEYMLDASRLAKAQGLLNTCHSAGYINPEPLAAWCEVLDAACIDLKAFDDKFYRELCDATLTPVLEALKTLRRRGVHVELVNLVIPQFNDRPEDLARMCAWIRDELGPLTPLHFSRFYPLYKLIHHYPTPPSALERAREIALKAGLKYVYIGNLPGHEAESTFCHNCGKLIIARRGYRLGEVNLKDGACAFCAAAIPGIWRAPKMALAAD
jgi:pyruvate formate lyase activating enzyme